MHAPLASIVVSAMAKMKAKVISMGVYLRKFAQHCLFWKTLHPVKHCTTIAVLTKARLSTSFSAAGSPQCLPIVFIHGIRLGRHIWDEHVRLLERDFRVIALDLPGHGALLDAQLTQANVNQQLLHIIENVVRRPAVLVGYSLGGLLAINFVQRFPEHTAGLVLAGATLDVTGWKRRAYDLLLAPALRLPRAACTAMLAGCFRLTLPRKVAQMIIWTPFNYDVFGQARDLVSGMRFSERLRGYRKPALFITGQFDLIFRPAQAHFAKQCAARSRIVRWTDHVLPLRRPQEFCDVLRDFCTQLQSR